MEEFEERDLHLLEDLLKKRNDEIMEAKRYFEDEKADVNRDSERHKVEEKTEIEKNRNISLLHAEEGYRKRVLDAEMDLMHKCLHEARNPGICLILGRKL